MSAGETRKLTPTERLHEVTMSALARTPAQPEHTVGLTLNAKGDVQIEVTGRGADIHLLVQHVVGEFDRLMAKYPRGATT